MPIFSPTLRGIAAAGGSRSTSGLGRHAPGFSVVMLDR